MDTIRFSYRIYLRRDIVDKNEKHPIFVDVRFKGERTRFSTGFSTNEKHWIENKKSVKLADSAAIRINNVLKNITDNLNKIEDSYMKGKRIDFTRIKDYAFGQDLGGDFHEFITAKIEQKKHSVENATYKSYKSNFKKLKRFRNKIYFNDLTLAFLREYEAFLYKEGNVVTTVAKAMKVLKVFVNMAIEEDLLFKSPFTNYRIRETKSTKPHLSEHELDRLSAAYYNNVLSKTEQAITRSFLFSCYSGLRYGDIVRMDFSNIKKDAHGNMFYEIVIGKTRNTKKQSIQLPLQDKAVELIPDQEYPKQKVFRTYTNQPTNKYLKKIMKSIGVTKNITFHCGRHTFGTLSGQKGVPVEVIQVLLNHTNIKETMIYRKVNYIELYDHLKKWESEN